MIDNKARKVTFSTFSLLFGAYDGDKRVGPADFHGSQKIDSNIQWSEQLDRFSMFKDGNLPE